VHAMVTKFRHARAATSVSHDLKVSPTAKSMGKVRAALVNL